MVKCQNRGCILICYPKIYDCCEFNQNKLSGLDAKAGHANLLRATLMGLREITKRIIKPKTIKYIFYDQLREKLKQNCVICERLFRINYNK